MASHAIPSHASLLSDATAVGPQTRAPPAAIPVHQPNPFSQEPAPSHSPVKIAPVPPQRPPPDNHHPLLHLEASPALESRAERPQNPAMLLKQATPAPVAPTEPMPSLEHLSSVHARTSAGGPPPEGRARTTSQHQQAVLPARQSSTHHRNMVMLFPPFPHGPVGCPHWLRTAVLHAAVSTGL